MDRPNRPETFKKVPGFSYYEASDLGSVRSLDRRTRDGRNVRGVVLKPRPNSSGYPQVNMTDDAGKVHTRTVHTTVLLAHAGPSPDGYEACHKDDDPTHNWYPENLRWDARPGNLADRMRNSPATPKPPKVCPRCQSEHTGPGRRCHECVVELGQAAAALLADGGRLEAVAEGLDYPSAPGLYELARRYGGLRVYVDSHVGLSMQSGEGKSAAAASAIAVGGKDVVVVEEEMNAIARAIGYGAQPASASQAVTGRLATLRDAFKIAWRAVTQRER